MSLGSELNAAAQDELAAWLRLLVTPGVGRALSRRMLAAYGSASAMFRGSTATRRELAGAAAAFALAKAPQQWPDLVRASLDWLAADRARRIVTLGDPDYPDDLLNTSDPPLLLYLQGRVELLKGPGVAIVGSRSPTAQGRDNAHAFAAELGRSGLVVVSGLARGIDGAAHEGALSVAAGTVAVVGTGLDSVYPLSHRKLADRIATQGLMVSEFPLGTPPLQQNFPMRNRVIAGISRATLVVEAAIRSGSLSTARMAAEAGREVMAVPGSIHSPQSRGCHALIRQGAKLVETAADVLEELHRPDFAAGSGAEGDSPSSDDPVLVAMGHDPVTLDAMLDRTGMAIADLQVRLMTLELEGQAARLPGGLYQRRSAA